MSGKLCTGRPMNNIGAGRIDESKAFCEGLAFRMTGTALEAPILANPHEAGSPDAVAWDFGWNHANDDAGSTLGIEHGRCCAVDYSQVIAA